MKLDVTPLFTGLPDAPLEMPKQTIERRRSLFSTLFSLFGARQRQGG